MANIAKIFVIIVTYKGHQWYERCFTSLRESELPVHPIVIDNASNDGTVEYIRENFPEIYLIESKENLGFGRANNLGMRYALDHGCDYVFLLNQDAWIEPNTLNELVRIHKKYPVYGVLSPMHLTADKKSIQSFLLSYLSNNTITDPILIQDLYFNTLQEIYSSKYINAAGWLLPRNTLETIGGFCPLIYHYGEDDDYLNRVIFHRKLIGICPSARMVHDTKERLKEGEVFFKESNWIRIDKLLDINSELNFYSLKLFLVKKMIKAILTFDFITFRQIKHKYVYLSKNLKQILFCREQQMKIQSTWL